MSDCNGCKYSGQTYRASPCNKCQRSLTDQFEKAEDKIIDMSCLVDSDTDCEFADDKSFKYLVVGRLSEVEGHVFRLEDRSNWYHCKVRENHIHFYNGPTLTSPISSDDIHLPKGLDIDIYYISGAVSGFKVLGTLDGWKYEHE